MKTYSEAITLTDQQRSAVDMVQQSHVSLLTGSPGTGKTFTVREILSWALSSNLRTILAAPTGKAAKRMSEVTAYPASTIHSALGAGMDDEGNFVFEHGEENPIAADLLILDEASMITNHLMAEVLRAVNPARTRVLIVGDPGQLPSIGAGAVLRDMIGCGVLPHVHLDKIHRNAGDIVKACHRIAAGEEYSPSPTVDLDKGMNLRHIECDTPEQARELITDIVVGRMPARGYHPMWDVQVISPTNSRGVLSCENLNISLQNYLNPAKETGESDKEPVKNGSKTKENGKETGKVVFRPGDKVIQTKNERLTDVNRVQVMVVNGDIGVIEMEDEKNFVVKFFDPDRIVRISRKKNDLLLAYAITCHRFQGSEAPVIVVPVHKSFGWFVNRAWIYTALSRAQDLCITVGQFRAVEMAIGRKEVFERKTMLQRKILERCL